METKDININNVLIAEFMGFTDDYLEMRKGFTSGELKYHSSWDWLMPVIGKISENCEEPEELDSLKYALLCDDINTAWSFVVDYLSN